MKRRTPVRGLHVLRHQRSSALILVLFFVVLLTAVTVVFLSRSMTARQVSNSSAGETKAILLANTAGDIIIGDLKQEIADGSTVTVIGTGTNIYAPKSPAAGGYKSTAIPAISGFTPAYSPTTGLETDGLNNLVKRSSYNAWTYSSITNLNYAQNGPTRASNANSATASLNGRVITPARWNSHYLLALADPTHPATTTPNASFVAPDWVIVARGGASRTYSTYAATLSDNSLANTNYAVGRYAYAVYDEGGLLDMNVAGHPSGLTAAQISQKGTLALADLTVLPVSTTDSTPVLTQTQIDNLVGWRNYASAKLSSSNGTYNSYTFDATTASNWLTNFAGSTNGYVKINTPTGVTTPPTDQALLSRQQLISLAQSLNFNLNALQYMGTFSRSLEQPSFTPDSHRPTIVAPTISPPAVTAVNTYQGNNTYVGGEIAINYVGSGLLSARVLNPFIRLDGTTAVIGEPLIKRKFALSRLALVTTTYAPVFATAAAAQAANDPVYTRFGIYRTSTSTAWIYDHGLAIGGVPSDSTHPPIVATLAQVAALSGTKAREPDFAELLKASINVGSVGKAGPSGQGSNDQYRMDVSGDMQILQIMANLIDQQKTDNYPTWIQYTQTFTSGVNVVRNVYGDQDLPYFYRWGFYGVTTQVPSTLLSSADTVTVNQPATVTTTVTPPGTVTVTHVTSFNLNHTRAGSALATPGTASYMIIPQIWNPHDANTPKASGGGPTVFRITVTTNMPKNTPGWASNLNWGIVAVPGNATTIPSTSSSTSSSTTGGITTATTISIDNGTSSNLKVIHFDGAPNNYFNADLLATSSSLPAAKNMTDANSFIQFTDGSGGKAFREPTLLWRNNCPNGVTLSGTSVTEDASITSSFTGSSTGITYFGLLASEKVPITWSWKDPQTGTSYVSQTSTLQEGTIVPGSSGSPTNQFTFDMQYQDPANAANWITYQESYVEGSLTDIGSYGLFVNPADYSSDNKCGNPLANGVNASSQPLTRPISGIFDPRTNRFTSPVAGSFTSDDATQNGCPTLDATTMVSNSTSNTGSINSAVAKSNFVLMKTVRPTTTRGQPWNYTTPCRGYDAIMHWYTSNSTCVGSNQVASDASFFEGMLSQNNPIIKFIGRDNTTLKSYYYEDPDGIARRAMGGYVGVSTGVAPTGKLTNTATTVGLPLATAGTPIYAGGSPGVSTGLITPTSQSQSRPILLHRPFRNVAEMSYAFRGTPWKNIDFFTPESGDTALLDVFCINEPPTNGLVAGKVNLNTRQPAVLKAIFASAYRDEFANLTTPPSSGTLPTLSLAEAGNLANTLIGITSSANAWEGPLANVGDIVGHYVYPDPGLLSATDVYQYTSPANSTQYTYSGFSAALSATSGVWDASNLTSTQNIQRFRESAIRPLADTGQTRVWNLLIDIAAQTGRYPTSAANLDQFVVEGEKRVWLHVAIDRYTGQVLDKQVEIVTQ